MHNPSPLDNTAPATPHIELLPPALTLRIGKHRLTLSRHPRKSVSHLLSGLLRRSWRAMFGSRLRVSLTVAAICAAWNTVALAAAPPVNTLPTGGTIVSGSATIGQVGNTMTINQTSNQAIGNFTSFSIGSGASVIINEPTSASSFLARVTGTDPSLIYGLLQSNGGVMLINQNGILVGQGGKVDVARFVASTINISDSDFLAGRLNFKNSAGTSGSVENQGLIQSASGGSVYLIGSDVSNSGIIHSPNGEVILAAGQTVQLVDTGTPGVTVNITGATGNVTNLGNITAEAGSIGIAAGLINNSGVINASSVVADGGRIFLRASQQLTTTASSSISADGANKGGSVVLYSDGGANIGGAVSATGAAGKGGYVETSGMTSLDVVNAPTVGSGGTWYIDPYDLEVVADGNNNIDNNTTTNIITSSGTSSTIRASDIDAQLNAGANVTLATGNGGAATGGNITVSSAIEMTGSTAATLTLDADNNIYINANITSGSATGLNLVLNTDYRDASTSSPHSVQVTGATIGLNGGTLKVNDGSTGNGNGNISINNGGVLNLSGVSQGQNPPAGGTVIAGNLTVGVGGSVSSTYGANVSLGGTFANSGTVNLANSKLNTTLFTNAGNANLSNVSGTISGGIQNDGALTLDRMMIGLTTGTINNNSTGTLTLTNDIDSGLTIADLNNAGLLTVSDSSFNVTGTLSNSGRLNVSGSSSLDGTLNNLGGGTVNVQDATANFNTISNSGTFNISNSSVATDGGFTNDAGGTVNVNYHSTFDSALINSCTMNFDSAANMPNGYSGDTTITLMQGVTNNGVLNMLGTIVSEGDINNNAGASIRIGASSRTTTISGGDWYNAGNLSIASGSTVSGVNFDNEGNVTLTAGNMAFDSFINDTDGTLAGTGTITVGGGDGMFYNEGTLAPGGIGTVGSLNISGGFTQTSTGTLLVDVGNAGGTLTYDQLNISSNDEYLLDGTLQTTLLSGSSMPALGTSFSPIVSGGNAQNFFRHVLGDVFTVNGALQMFKANYDVDKKLQLSMSGSEDFTFIAGDGGVWGSLGNWSTGDDQMATSLPTAIDNIIVNSGSLRHTQADGTDIVNNITIGSDAGLNLVGGVVKANNLTSTGTVTIQNEGESPVAGNLSISGTAQMSSLSVLGYGVLNGDAGSVVNVTGSFQQDSSGSIVSAGDVFLTQLASSGETEGFNSFVTVGDSANNLVVGNITARNLVLVSQAGDIEQADEGSQLVVTRQLITSSSTGTTLGNTNNQISAFAGTNTDSGDIVLRNNLNTNYTSAVAINGITNLNGSISVDNTGALVTTAMSGADSIAVANSLNVTTSGLISATAAGSNVSVSTHSPLTIGAAGINAAGDILLSAGASSSPTNDNLVINGAIASSGGNINLLAGNSIGVNANISTSAPGTASITAGNGGISYASGVSITDESGTRTPVPATSSAIDTTVIAGTSNDSISSLNDAQQNSSSNSSNTSNSSAVSNSIDTSTPASTTTFTTSSGQTMTTGGEAGTFGGSDSADADTGTSSGASNKKTVAKLYCS